MHTIELLSLIDEHVKDATIDDLIELFTSPPAGSRKNSWWM